jgi:hypothetical protein
VQQVAADPALRAELGQRAQAGFRRHYTADRHLAAYMAHVDGIRAAKGLH